MADRGKRALRAVAGLAAALAAGAVQAADIECQTNKAGQRFVVYEGSVAPKDGERFRGVFARCYDAAYRGSMTVLLFSGGGIVDEGLAIARFLVEQSRSRGPVTVRVPKDAYCISACTYIFAAGAFRQVDTGASLEPHGFSAYAGLRLDRALARLLPLLEKEPAKAPQLKAEIKVIRLVFAGKALEGLLNSDARLGWLLSFYATALGGLPRDDFVIVAMKAFAALNGEQRRLVAEIDSIVNLVVTEIEREAALAAFRPHLDALAGRPRSTELGLITGKEEQHARWMNAELQAALNRYLARAKAGAPLRDLGPVPTMVAQLQAERVRDTMGTVDAKLWPFLRTRSDDIDLEGFVRLMFSTSILYTRPLTREELCDFNLVNSGCS